MTNAAGNLTQVIEPDPQGGADLNTNYTYDLLNHLTQVSMPRGAITQTRTFVYDAATQQLSSATNPETGTVNFTYNADGTLATKVDAKGQKVQFTYDAKQRKTAVQRYPNGTTEDVCQGTTFAYDTPASGFTNGNGRLTYQAWGTGCANGYSFWENYGYSAGGLVTKKRLHVNSQSAVTGRDLDVTYSYNNEGQMTAVKYPSADVNTAGTWSVTTGAQYTYTFDAMGRPTKLTDDDATRPVDRTKDVTYNVAGRITQMRYLATKGATTAFDAYYLETKSFNNLFQLTRLTTVAESTSTTVMDMEYRFSATQNNAALTQQKDWVNGEELTFAYDSLQRVISAVTTGPEWGVSFTFDGFGNKTASTVTKGTAPTSSLVINGSNNRITTSGFAYDANGNLTSIPGLTGLSYDVSNRLVAASGDQYSYGPGSKRIWTKYPSATEEFYFYGAGGEKLATYSPVISGSHVYMTAPKVNLYFAGKRIRVQDTVVAVDAGGSVRSGGLRYFPFGEEQSATTQDKDKFGTYYRDSSTGLDYAGHRFYSSQLGRFVTPDPYGGSASAGTPQSWNRYAYGLGDPVNWKDATGLYSQWIWAADANGVATGGSLVEFADPVGESAAERFERLEATASNQRGDVITNPGPVTAPPTSVTVNAILDGVPVISSNINNQNGYISPSDPSRGANGCTLDKVNKPEDCMLEEDKKALANVIPQTPAEAVELAQNIVGGCIAGAFGAEALAGVGAVALGLPTIPKPFVTPGSSAATSVASYYLSQWINIDIGTRLWAPTVMRPLAATANGGRFLGRWVPFVGWALVIKDVADATACVKKAGEGITANVP